MPIQYIEKSPAVKKGEPHTEHKILVNPYHGCSHNCLFCPANDGFLNRKAFENYRTKKTIYVIQNIVDHVVSFVSSNSNPDKVVHLSPVADPFQPAEDKYHLSQKVIDYCCKQKIPVAICTKGNLSEQIIEKIKNIPRSFVQISIPTINPDKHKLIVRGDGAKVEKLLSTIDQLVNNQIHVVVRVDPIYPYITDNLGEFEEMVAIMKEKKVRYILSSCADIIPGALEREKEYLESISHGLYEKYRVLYTDKIQNRLHAAYDYRISLFSKQKSICQKHTMSYGITWEPNLDGSSINNMFSYIADIDKETGYYQELSKYNNDI